VKFYSFEDIRAVGDCAAFARDVYGAKVAHGRCNAAWRGGDGVENVSIDREKWYDHVSKQGGGIIELAAQQFGGDIQQAQAYLGEYYGLQPKAATGPQPARDGRFDALIRQGYREIKRYGYHDLDGNLVHFVSRLEHDTKPKEFCQGTPAGWGLGDVSPILYNLRGITDSPWCCIVEGEKKADLLIQSGIPATTCCGGAKKWHSGYAAHLAGKSVAILPDNDDPGQEHARIIAASLAGVAADVRIIQTSASPKGDVYDYLTTEGHTVDDLLALIASSTALTPDDTADVAIPAPDTSEIKAAKSANQIPFRNYIPVKQAEAQEKQAKRRNPTKPDIDRRPRLISEMLDDCHRRFLGFPRKVGEELFDHDRETERIVYMYRSAELFAWIGRKSKQKTEWARGDSFVTKDELLAGLSAAAIRYEAISHVPDWPRRSDVYYAHKPLPPPCPTASRFWALVDSFCPASDVDRLFLAAFMVAPLWYVYGIPKPSWIIDSEDGAGTGKSTVVEIAAHLYCGEPIRTNRQELRMGIQELIKRMISSQGRQQRIVLVDNVTGQFSCPELADLITAQSISGRAPYGRGEETRPNNLVYVLTANTATVDNDIADRSYYINVRRPERNDNWKTRMIQYVDKHRFEIIADITAILDNPNRIRCKANTRFPEFETSILQALCADEESYTEAIAHLSACRSDTNVEDEQARVIEDTIRDNLVELKLHPENDTVFIRSNVIEHWFKDVMERRDGWVMQHIRNLAKMRLIPKIDPQVKRYPHHGEQRRAGILWNNSDQSMVKILTMNGRNVETMLCE